MLKLVFQSRLENIAEGMRYFAIPVPATVTKKLGTKASVPVKASVNGSEEFVGSFSCWGEGRHYLRVRYKICELVGIRAGEKVKVVATVRDRSEEIAAPKGLSAALKKAKLSKGFGLIPPGEKSFLLRKLAQAAKRETKEKRLADIFDAAAKRLAKGT